VAEGTTLSPVSCTVPTPLTPKIWPSAPNIFSKIFLHHYIFRTRVSIWLYSSMTCGHIIGVRTIFHLPRTSHYCTLVAVLIWDITGSPHNVILCSLIPIPYYSIHPLQYLPACASLWFMELVQAFSMARLSDGCWRLRLASDLIHRRHRHHGAAAAGADKNPLSWEPCYAIKLNCWSVFTTSVRRRDAVNSVL